MTKVKDEQISALAELNAMHQENEQRLEAENIKLKRELEDARSSFSATALHNEKLRAIVKLQEGWINCKMDRMPNGSPMVQPDRVEPDRVEGDGNHFSGVPDHVLNLYEPKL